MRRLAVLFATLGLLWAFPALAKPPVWTVHGPGATITLFGSVHVLPRDLDWRPDQLDRALADADELWFETPIDPATILETARLALAQGLLPPGQSLSALLSERARARLSWAEDTLHLPGPQLERLRPWLAELTIGDAAYAREGVTADQGVERQLAEAAPQAQRRSFETPAQQIAMFAGSPQAVQVASLEDTLRELQEDPGQSRRLIDAWLAGDLAALDREGVQELRRSSAVLFKTLLTDRNAAWTKVLSARLKAPPAGGRPVKIVAVVGVGHLVGPGGLPELLRRQGLRVDGPSP